MRELPLDELESLGLLSGGRILLSEDDVEALLAGRRTGMIQLNDLHTDAYRIDQLDAKLSVTKDQEGKLFLKVHPIYKAPQPSPLLKEAEADSLIQGKINRILKITPQPEEDPLVHIIEYDPETREFISYQPKDILVPEMVNFEPLNTKQKEEFRNGEIVKLQDGTQLQYRAGEPKGITSDRAALILSVLIDGGISYLLLRTIRNIIGNKAKQQDHQTPGFLAAEAEMQARQQRADQFNARKHSGVGNPSGLQR